MYWAHNPQEDFLPSHWFWRIGGRTYIFGCLILVPMVHLRYFCAYNLCVDVLTMLNMFTLLFELVLFAVFFRELFILFTKKPHICSLSILQNNMIICLIINNLCCSVIYSLFLRIINIIS